ncbi:UNVERIFIED_CONTAM: Subtilisin-like protease SBT1.8 [Sesamum radiatum]|uniref:Subtilisin-like protease SBT1.8 n=1 Tax=Sesamum radiatum TaxID=300843 RepID=A0AAW2R2X0_SESRA
MGLPSVVCLCAAVFLLHSSLFTVSAKKTYIVQMNHHQKPPSYSTHGQWYSDHLQALTSAAPDSILYTYDLAYNGFAAALSDEEVESLRQSDSVLDVYEDPVYTLHTTRTPEFLGLGDTTWQPGRMRPNPHAMEMDTARIRRALPRGLKWRTPAS